MMSETELLASRIVQNRLDASKRVENELRATGRHMDADLLRSLRIGYSSAIQTCKRLHADNKALRAERDDLRARLADAEGLRELRNFLGGTAPLDGVWFGEDHPTKKGRFWWREELSRIDNLTVGSAALSPAGEAAT